MCQPIDQHIFNTENECSSKTKCFIIKEFIIKEQNHLCK